MELVQLSLEKALAARITVPLCHVPSATLRLALCAGSYGNSSVDLNFHFKTRVQAASAGQVTIWS